MKGGFYAKEDELKDAMTEATSRGLTTDMPEGALSGVLQQLQDFAGIGSSSSNHETPPAKRRCVATHEADFESQASSKSDMIATPVRPQSAPDMVEFCKFMESNIDK